MLVLATPQKTQDRSWRNLMLERSDCGIEQLSTMSAHEPTQRHCKAFLQHERNAGIRSRWRALRRGSTVCTQCSEGKLVKRNFEGRAVKDGQLYQQRG